MGGTLNTWATWVGIICGVLTIFTFGYAGTRWARKQLKDAIYDDIHPLLTEIGLSVNNVGAGEPKLIDRVKNTERIVVENAMHVKQAEQMALESATASKLAAGMAEETAKKLNAHLAELGET